MEKLVSIIIRTYNEEKHIGKLLSEIYKQDFPKNKLEILVVDSDSTDKTVDIAQSFPIKLVKITPEEFTFGYSLNKGIENATGKYMLMISAHCYPVNKNWIKNMIKPFEKDDNIAVVYGKQRGKSTTKYSEHQIFKKWFPDCSPNKQDHPFSNNANCAIRKKLWNEYKYNEYLTGLEDLDWAHNIISKGYFVFYQSKAGVYHIHKESYTQIYNRYKREAIALKDIFPDIKFNFFDFITLFFSNTITDLFSAFQDDVLLKEFKSISLFRFMQFFGTYKGHKFDNKITKQLKNKFYYP